MDDQLDHPAIISTIFFPRQAHPGRVRRDDGHDGHVDVEDGVRVGYRLYMAEPQRPLILYFHGNGEIAAEHDDIAHLYNQRVGANLLVVDFRGYGWSTGSPKTSAMLPDAEKVFGALPEILADRPPAGLFVMGRSLGGPSAMHLAGSFPEQIDGLIVESTLSDIHAWLLKKGFAPNILPEPSPRFNFAKRLETVDVPLLVIHGTQDQLIPPTEGRKLYSASPAEHKRLLLIEGAGHNTLIAVGRGQYFDTIATFITTALEG
jgi:hypothetical protein